MTDIDDIDKELGPNPQGVYGSVRVRLDILESRINNPNAPAPTVTNPFIIGNDGVIIATGIGPPEFDAVPGSLYLREDGYTVGGTNLSIYNFVDGYGWVPVQSGAGGSFQTLAQVLNVGNTTSGKNIVLSGTDAIVGNDGYVRLTGVPLVSTLSANSALITRSDGGVKSLSLSGAQFAVLMENPIGTLTFSQITQDMIQSAFAITLSGGTNVEVGQTVTTPAFTATYNRSAVTAVLTDSDGNTPKNVISTPTSFSSNFSYTKNSFGSTEIFTLTANDGTATKTATTTYTWLQKSYHGVGSAGQNTAAFILSLTGNLISTRATSFTDNASSSQKIYFACRSAYGTPTFTVGGFSGGFTLVSNTISVTNTHGFTENYQLWESDNLGLGSTTIIVS